MKVREVPSAQAVEWARRDVALVLSVELTVTGSEDA